MAHMGAGVEYFNLEINFLLGKCLVNSVKI